MTNATPLLSDFAHFIAQRVPPHTPWPRIYDEMCHVARTRAFRGMGYVELAEAGISLALTDLDHLGHLIEEFWQSIPA